MPYYKVAKVNQVKELKDYSKPSALMPSYIGMLDISTVNDTLEKVQAKYGTDTTWIQHSGYVLRGATSGVTSNDATKTGGNDNAIVPYHTHTEQGAGGHSHTTNNTWLQDVQATSSTSTNRWTPAGGYTGGSYSQTITNSVSNHTHTINYAGTSGNTTNANIPNYKSVYIWERTA